MNFQNGSHAEAPPVRAVVKGCRADRRSISATSSLVVILGSLGGIAETDEFRFDEIRRRMMSQPLPFKADCFQLHSTLKDYKA
ncbi:MAG: hypothetical protein E5V44_02900 [Mesorhizobium sp.]|nr:MAG: hypothetical protein E5V44_02900 [Mesorhizobium sp.]